MFGHVQQIVAAQGKIARVLAENAPEWAEDTAWGVRLVIQVLPEMAPVVIGKKGSAIQVVERESQAKVDIAKEADSDNLQAIQVRLPILSARRCCGCVPSGDVPHPCSILVSLHSF